MMRGLWYKVPSDLLNCDYISKGDCKVFAYVADRIKGETKAVSVRSIAAATDMSARSVQRSLAKLVECKYLRAETRAGRATLYTQLLIPISKRDREEGYEDEPTQDIYLTRGKRSI